MRIGMNPQKEEKKIDLIYNHRIIIVVYIPELSGYYENLLQVFKLCLESIAATKNDKCAITVVNNASCDEVLSYINLKFKEGIVDSVIHHKINIGKIDAIIGAARGSREPLITMTDVDILFKNGWQENIEKIFMTFEGVGSVSPISVRKNTRYGTTSTIKRILLKKVDFKLQPIPENFEDHNRLLKSINKKTESSTNNLWAVVEKNNVKALLGSGHQVLTIDRNILFMTVPFDPSLVLIGGNSEFKYVDEPIDKFGGMRLATYNNYAYHMGNKVEKWMVAIQEENLIFNNNKKDGVFKFEIPKYNFKKPININWFNLSSRIYLKLFTFLYIKKIDQQDF